MVESGLVIDPCKRTRGSRHFPKGQPLKCQNTTQPRTARCSVSKAGTRTVKPGRLASKPHSTSTSRHQQESGRVCQCKPSAGSHNSIEFAHSFQAPILRFAAHLNPTHKPSKRLATSVQLAKLHDELFPPGA